MALFLLLLLSVCSFSSVTSQCYDQLGCFYREYPWYSVLRPVLSPASPTQIDTKFYLANRKYGPAIPIQTWPRIDVKGSYDSRKPTFVITHGFLSHIRMKWCSKMTDAILSKTAANVILVDWKKGARNGYLKTLSNIRIVAAEISRLIRYLITHHSAKVSSFHLLGHSLGAHIMSYVGKSINGIARITALDPARPGFQGKHPIVRLHSDDAKFVDVLHTDGRPFLGLGMTDSVGQVDFYFNGGIKQPKCITDGMRSDLKSLLNVPKMTINLLYNLAVCSHERAAMYMVAAIEKCHMWAHPFQKNVGRLNDTNFIPIQACTFKICTVVGLDTPKYPSFGDFFVPTTGKYPYCSA